MKRIIEQYPTEGREMVERVRNGDGLIEVATDLRYSHIPKELGISTLGMARDLANYVQLD